MLHSYTNEKYTNENTPKISPLGGLGTSGAGEVVVTKENWWEVVRMPMILSLPPGPVKEEIFISREGKADDV